MRLILLIFFQMEDGIKSNPLVSSLALEKRRASEELLSVLSVIGHKQILKTSMLTEWVGADFEHDYWELFSSNASLTEKRKRSSGIKVFEV